VSLKILLADDSMTAQNMGKKILSDAGYEVVAVSNGAAALKKINAGQFDLLLLDVMMPGYTGPEVCAKARDLKNYAKTPILFTIGKMELGEFKVEDAPKLKGDGVLIKPFEASDLITAVQKLTAAAAPKPARVIPTVPPEAEKTARITPITEETDQSFAEWSATAPEHREGEEPAAPRSPGAVEMPAEAAATAAFDEVAAAPTFEAVAGSAPTFDLGAPSYETSSTEAAPADLSTAAPSFETASAPPTFEASSMSAFETPIEASAIESPIPIEPAALEIPIPLEAAAAPLSSLAPELETTPEPVQLGHVEPPPGFEATAHEAVNIHVETAPELEIPSIHDRTPVQADPNFVSDRSQMVEEFATKFSDAGPEVTVGVVSEEPEAAVAAPSVGDETCRISPWVSEPAEVHVPEHAVVDFTPPESPGLHLGLSEFAAEIESAPMAAPEPEPPVVELAAPAAEPEVVAEPEPPSMAAELEQAMSTADAPEEPAPAPEPQPPATLEASLEQSLEPQPETIAVAEVVAAEEPKKSAGDLEFAQALEAAIAHAPEAPPEPHHEETPAPRAQAHAAAASALASAVARATPAEPEPVAAVAAEETGKFAAMPEFDGVDPKIIATAIERVLANAKSQILEEVLKELKK
jgi:CheY-like chemotaxis protein